jgi:hypothetical protein
VFAEAKRVPGFSGLVTDCEPGLGHDKPAASLRKKANRVWRKFSAD